MTASGRPVSGLERLWLVADRLHAPFVNQMVIEGDGEPPRPSSDLLARLAEALPGFRGRLAGHLGGSRFEGDGPLPAVREVDGTAWDGQGPAGAPFLAAPLDPRRGPTNEILLVAGSPARLVLRTHHALTDGQGTRLMAQALLCALRGEPVAPAAMGPLDDLALARGLGVAPERIPPNDSAAPQGQAQGTGFATTWARRRVPGRFRRFLPRLILALARMRPLPEGCAFRVIVPVDLRPHAGEGASTANLTGLLRLPVHEHLRAADPLAGVAAVLEDGVARKEAARVLLSSAFARHVPLALMAAIARGDARRALAKGRYGSAAIVSNVGRIDVAALSCPGFTARRAFFVPPGNPGLPLFLAIAGDDEGVELCATVPEPLATGGRLATLLDVLAGALAS